MDNYIIFTDSGCDIEKATLENWGVRLIPLSFHFSDDEKEFKEGDMALAEFYDKMRKGGVAKTSAVNMETFKDAFRAELEAGNDVLYMGFSSGLSNTYNAGRLAAEELLEEFPDRRVIAVDTLAASAGQGLFVYLATEKKKEGATIEEVARFVLDNRDNLCHWFTVEDLKYLKRGGRVSATAAFVGGMLNIKPVLHVDNEGHLINMQKVRGRKASFREIASRYDALAVDKNGIVFISHGDCLSDAEEMGRILSEEHGAKVELITNIGTVIGAHSGPGTIAVFFLGKEK
ncbi:MAG: DegV family protein [Oscillospiraceae bacterium]|nr:DegV family protein [Oscillospiraceae bacterium]